MLSETESLKLAKAHLSAENHKLKLEVICGQLDVAIQRSILEKVSEEKATLTTRLRAAHAESQFPWQQIGEASTADSNLVRESPALSEASIE